MLGFLLSFFPDAWRADPLSLKAKRTSFPQVLWTVKVVRVLDEQDDDVPALDSMTDEVIVMIEVLPCFVAEIAGLDRPDLLTSGVNAAVLQSFEGPTG